MPNASVIGKSVAAMMRRGMSPAESRLILAASGRGLEGPDGDPPARR